MTKLEALNKLKELSEYYQSLPTDALNTYEVLGIMDKLNSLYLATELIKE